MVKNKILLDKYRKELENWLDLMKNIGLKQFGSETVKKYVTTKNTEDLPKWKKGWYESMQPILSPSFKDLESTIFIAEFYRLWGEQTFDELHEACLEIDRLMPKKERII